MLISEQLQGTLSEARRSGGTPTPPDLAATGNCYEDAVHALMNQRDWLLVHGRPTLRRPPFVEFGHAWLEKGDKVYDPSTGYRGARAGYYMLGNIDHKNNLVYTFDEARQFLLASEHYGPWEGPDGVPVPPARKKEWRKTRGFTFKRSKRATKPKGMPKAVKGKQFPAMYW